MLINGIDFSEQLLRAQSNAELVIFAGAGVSCPPPSSLPLFGELARRVGQASGIQRGERESEDRYLGRLKARGVHVHEAVARILVNDQTHPHELHHLLLQLFPSTQQVRLVTTNFDTHFSTAIDTGTEVYYAPALPVGDDFSGLVYLHGCAARDPKRCVLTDEDFGRAYLTQAWASRFLAAMFSRFAVLFVGYSHNDPVMNYLARGLPPVAQRPRFAFTTDDEESLAKWQFLGIQPLKYQKSEGENPHRAITESIRGWVSEVRRGLLEKAERIRSIVETQPPLEGEDSDYIRFSLCDPDTARLFFKYARLPEWISWLEKHRFLQPLFNPNGELSQIDREMALWLTQSFFVEYADYLMAAIQRNGGRLHTHVCQFISFRLRRREREPDISSVFSRWAALLLAQPYGVLSDEDWALVLHQCGYPGDLFTSVLLFEAVTRPRIELTEPWSFGTGEEDQPAKIRFELNLVRDRNHWLSESWENLFLPNILAFATVLEPSVTANLAAAHGLMTICDREYEDHDVFYPYRQSIEENGQSPFPKVADALIDAGREILRHLNSTQSVLASGLIEKWHRSEIPILQRLAIHGFAENRSASADEKLAWLIRSDFLYKFKADVFWLLRHSYPQASDNARRLLLDRAMQGPKGRRFEQLAEGTKVYETFNLIVWLKRAAPNCPLVQERYYRLRRENPDFEEREFPELDFWFGGVRSIDPAEGFNIEEIVAKPADDFLAKILTGQHSRGIDGWGADPSSVVSAAVRNSPQWGVEFIRALIARELNTGDLWRAACQGWRDANISELQWDLILSLAETVEAPLEFFEAFAEVLEHGSRREQNAIPDPLMAQAQRVAERIWRSALATKSPDKSHYEDWLTEAINRPGGKLAQFWLQRISLARKLAGEAWEGLPPEILSGLRDILRGNSGPAAHARVVLASQLHYFFSLDSTFANADLLPLFDWKQDELCAEQSWHGFLAWGRWLPGFTESLLPYFSEMINRKRSVPDSLRQALANHIAGVALFRLENPLKDEWLLGVMQVLPDEDRCRLAATVDRSLEESDVAIVEGIWSRWLREYWDMRLLGIPQPLLAREANEMACWAFSVGRFFPDAVKMVEKMSDSLSFEQTLLPYRMDKKGLAKVHPEAAAELLLLYLQAPNTRLYEDEHLRNVWRLLCEANISSTLLRRIREEMFRKGFDPGGR